jgi:hypothetical protein
MKSRVSVSTFAVLVALVAAGRVLAQGPVSEWPREFTTPKGHTIVVYQPQAETFQGDRATGRAAVSFTKKGEAVPKFGVVFFSARVSVDRDARVVSVLNMKVSRVRFPGITPENEKKFTDSLEAEVPKWDLVFSYDRLLENVKVAEREKKSAQGLRHEPPKIVFAEEPTVLVSFDGEPAFREVEDAPVKVAVNTSFLVLQDTRSSRYYLSGGKKWWYEASRPLGPWRTVSGPPPDIAAFAAKAMEEQKKNEKDATDEDGTESASPPKVLVATEPTEIIVTEGKPSLKPIAGTDGNLLAVDNTEADLLLDVTKQDYYVLLSGRWFRSKSLGTGAAWTYVPPDAVPESFAKIPPESDSGDVRAAVAGTDEAEEAVLDAQIPQTTAVRRAEATLDVRWDGAPKFIPIEGSATSYAANASTSVLLIRNRYYACENAVWFVADSPDGPWAVADSVPSDDLDAIPPSAPVYNVKYVRIYDATPDVVYVGYTPGYTGVYPWGGTVVWGTGWTYAPWVGPTYWWPRPYTWGLCAHYNPWTGWGFGFSWSYPFFNVSLGWGGWFRPRGWYGPAYGGWGGGWHRPGGWGWYGPGGYRPPAPIAGHYWGGHGGGSWNRPLPGRRPGGAVTLPGARPIPGVRPDIGFRPPSREIRRPAPSNIYNRLPAKTRDVPRAPSAVGRPRPATGRPNNVYADKTGEVYRRTKEGQWQQREGDRWRTAGGPTAKPGSQPGTTARPGGGQPGATARPGGGQPGATVRPAPAPVTRPAPRPELDRDFSARQRGDQRMQERSYARPAPQSHARPAPQQARPAPQQARPAPAPAPKPGGGEKRR